MAFRKQKKGFLTLAFSMMFYFFALIAVLIIFGIAGCILEEMKSESRINGKTESAATIRAEMQLNSYLRTPIPEKKALFEKLDWLKMMKEEGYQFAKTHDVESAKAFIEKYPEVHTDKDYQGFLGSLYSVYTENPKEEDNTRKAFQAITAVLFMREKGNGKPGNLFYIMPLSVDYEKASMGGCASLSGDLCLSYLPPEFVTQRRAYEAVRAIPLPGRSIAKVKFVYYPELTTWLANP